jgi:hypothetical protein
VEEWGERFWEVSPQCRQVVHETMQQPQKLLNGFDDEKDVIPSVKLEIQILGNVP